MQRYFSLITCRLLLISALLFAREADGMWVFFFPYFDRLRLKGDNLADVTTEGCPNLTAKNEGLDNVSEGKTD